MPVHYPDQAGKAYQPSNGQEGDIFMGRFCELCTKDNNSGDSDAYGCGILFATLFLDTKDKDYPKEWIYDPEGHPTCTAFESTYEHKS